MAQATATVTFTSAGPDSQAFTWSPALTSATPKVTGLSISVTATPTESPQAWLDGVATNTGGTIKVAAAFDGTVTVTGED